MNTNDCEKRLAEIRRRRDEAMEEVERLIKKSAAEIANNKGLPERMGKLNYRDFE